jgi:hypothetical protein
VWASHPQEYALPSRRETPGPPAFFELVHKTFHRAEATGGALERYYEVAGHPIRLRFAGRALVPFITLPLAHLASQPVPSPTLTICLWDNASTGTVLPHLPWSAHDFGARGEIRGYNDGRIHTALYAGDSMLSMLDSEQGLALFCIRDSGQFPSYQRGSPLLTILHWSLRCYGLQFVHAAAVGTESLGGVLMVGKGGSGKSTAALSCLNSELSYVGDDYCLLAVEPTPFVHSLYNSAKVHADGLQRFPDLAPTVHGSFELDSGKRLLFVHQHCPGKTTAGVALRAVLVPRITGGSRTTLDPVSSMTGLTALAPSTIFQLSGAGHSALQTMAELVRQIPCYRLDLGTDLAQIPEVILGLLSGG